MKYNNSMPNPATEAEMANLVVPAGANAELLPDIDKDLSDLGLLEFAQGVGFLGRPGHEIQPAQGQPQQQNGPCAPGYSNGGPAGHQAAPAGHYQQISQQDANTLAVNATAEQHVQDAERAVAESRHRLQHILAASYSSRPAAAAVTSSTCASGGRSSKRARLSADSRSTAQPTQKGLRAFSMKVCEKVESKGRTTYQEVRACPLGQQHAKISACIIAMLRGTS